MVTWEYSITIRNCVMCFYRENLRSGPKALPINLVRREERYRSLELCGGSRRFFCCSHGERKCGGTRGSNSTVCTAASRLVYRRRQVSMNIFAPGQRSSIFGLRNLA
jgi:hypothetical protein